MSDESSEKKRAEIWRFDKTIPPAREIFRRLSEHGVLLES